MDSLVDVLRGRTKVHTHCYTMNDLDAMVHHSTEFGFPIAAFHHAHETYLVPELLHKAYEHPPAVAMFSQNANYKYESYFGTPFAATLLRAASITPIFKVTTLCWIRGAWCTRRPRRITMAWPRWMR